MLTTTEVGNGVVPTGRSPACPGSDDARDFGSKLVNRTVAAATGWCHPLYWSLEGVVVTLRTSKGPPRVLSASGGAA